MYLMEIVRKTVSCGEPYPLARLGDERKILFIDIETTGFSRENNAIYLIGCGIPEDALQKIFTGSYEKSTAPVDGTRSNMGIGLSVCATIVKAHGSEITAGNRKDGGAVFRFALERGGEDDGQ